jgi:hypothetical protein
MDNSTTPPALETIAAWIEDARRAPIRPWRDYAFELIPFVVYDDHATVYINHPSPPDERPATLMAATAVEIGGVQTATLPAFMFQTEADTLPIAYHEGFHVYQAAHFASHPADMFTAMAHYPELDPAYRALCRVEADVLNNATRNPAEKLAVIAAVIRQRRAILEKHPSLIAYERYLERNEGTASYVEHAVRLALFDIAPKPVESDTGWSRFYSAGAALCRLLDATVDGWQARVEAGESPGDIALALASDEIDLDAHGLAAALADENAAVAEIRAGIDALIQPLQEPDAVIIEYPAQGAVYRAFSPATLQSLGDGRILHRTMFKLLRPGKGHIGADNVAVIDDIAQKRVLLPKCQAEFDGSALRIQGGGIDVSLTGVTKRQDHVYRIES